MNRLVRACAALTVLVTTSLTVLSISAGAANAGAEYAPLDRPGPALTPSPSKLAASLTCSPGWATSKVRPVLILSGTTINVMEEFAWNWIPALDAQHIPWCASTALAERHNSGDITQRAEYVVYAIRAMYAASGKKIAILGHSQGAGIPRWAMRFWPDTRTMVEEVVGLSPANQGTASPVLAVCLIACPAAAWQQLPGSKYNRAMNSGRQTFPGIDYTVIWSPYDEIAFPGSFGKLPSDGGNVRNIAVQEVCPHSIAEHFATGSFDSATYALGIDALTHPGNADPARVSRKVCDQLLMPYVNPQTLVPAGLRALLDIGYGAVLANPLLTREPDLPCYVYARGCA